MNLGPVIDTHVALWILWAPDRLSSIARGAVEEAGARQQLLILPTISLVEITYLCEKNRIPSERLPALLAYLRHPRTGFRLAPLDEDVAKAVQQIPRDLVPDMPDRIIAATAIALDRPLISADGKIRQGPLQVLW